MAAFIQVTNIIIRATEAYSEIAFTPEEVKKVRSDRSLQFTTK